MARRVPGIWHPSVLMLPGTTTVDHNLYHGWRRGGLTTCGNVGRIPAMWMILGGVTAYGVFLVLFIRIVGHLHQRDEDVVRHM
jgi:hypothetical protein